MRLCHCCELSHKGRNELTDYELPAGIKVVPAGLFMNNLITQLKLPATVSDIGSYAFYNNRLTAIDIPGHVRTIGTYAFNSNRYLRTIQLNEGLVEIGAYAFRVTGLDMDELRMPSTLRTVGMQAFEGTASTMRIERLILNEGLTSVGTSAFRKVQMRELSLSHSLTTIGVGVFQDNYLTQLDLHDEVTSIGNNAFSNNYLSEVRIDPASSQLTQIGNHAFYNNRNLRDFALPNGLQTIGEYAFANNQLTQLVVPEGVTSIGRFAYNNNRLQSLSLPDSLTSLGDYAFFSNQLKTVALPPQITAVPAYVFGSNLLETVELAPGTTSIGNSAFMNNNLTKLELPETLKSIGNQAFMNNQLTELVLPNGVTSIGSLSFDNNRISDLTLSQSLATIPTYAFRYNRLTTLKLPAGVTTIEHSAFRGNQLDTIVVEPGSQLATIGPQVFSDNRLSTLELPASMKTIDGSAFGNNSGAPGRPDLVAVYIRDGEGAYVNPNGIDHGTGFRINEGLIRVRKVLVNSDLSIAADELIYAPIGTSQKISPQATVAYEPVDPTPLDVTVAAEETELVVEYRARDDFDASNLTIDLVHAQGSSPHPTYPRGLGPRDYPPNTNIPILVKVESSGDIVAIPKPWIIIDLNASVPGGHINPNVQWPTNMSNFASEWKVEDGQIKIHLKNDIQASMAVEIPLYLQFKQHETPNHFVLDLTGRAYLAQGDQVIKRSDPTKPIGIRAQAGTKYYTKYVEGVATTLDVRQGTVDEDGYLVDKTEQPIRFTYRVTGSTNPRSTERIYIKEFVPSYEGKNEDDESATLRAIFVPELSPGWTLVETDPDAPYVELDVSHAYTLAPPVYQVAFRFPRAKVTELITNTMSFELTPSRRAEDSILDGAHGNANAAFKGPETAYGEEPLFKGTAPRQFRIHPVTSSYVDPTGPGEQKPQAEVLKRSISFYGDSGLALAPEQRARATPQLQLQKPQPGMVFVRAAHPQAEWSDPLQQRLPRQPRGPQRGVPLGRAPRDPQQRGEGAQGHGLRARPAHEVHRTAAAGGYGPCDADRL